MFSHDSHRIPPLSRDRWAPSSPYEYNIQHLLWDPHSHAWWGFSVVMRRSDRVVASNSLDRIEKHRSLEEDCQKYTFSILTRVNWQDLLHLEHNPLVWSPWVIPCGYRSPEYQKQETLALWVQMSREISMAWGDNQLFDRVLAFALFLSCHNSSRSVDISLRGIESLRWSCHQSIYASEYPSE